MSISSQAREFGGIVAGNQMFHTGETSRNMGTGSQMQMQVSHQETGIGYYLKRPHKWNSFLW